MQMNTLALAIANRMNNREALIEPSAMNLQMVLSHLARADVDVEEVAASEWRQKQLLARYGMSASVEGSAQERKPFAYANGYAVIPVQGLLLNRCDWSWPGYLTGYNFIRSQALAAAEDDDVHTIVFDMDSGGGEAAGCFELCDDLYAIREQKQTVAVVDSNCYSACYGIASTAHKIIVTPSGGAGSVGVVSTHISLEGLLDKAGVKVTFIYAGDRKVDGNPYQDLPDDVKERIQANVNLSYDAFVSQVSRNRGMTDAQVRNTKAQVFRAQDALKLGLIDAIEPPSKALSVFIDLMEAEDDDTEPVNPDQTDEESTMNQAQKPGGIDQAAHDKAVKESAESARSAERARVAGIMNCEEAKGRTTLANHLAMSTDMSIENAQAVLAASEKKDEKPAAEVTSTASKGKDSAFLEAMNNGKHPNIGADDAGEGGGGSSDLSDEAQASQILAAQGKAMGRKNKEAA